MGEELKHIATTQKHHASILVRLSQILTHTYKGTDTDLLHILISSWGESVYPHNHRIWLAASLFFPHIVLRWVDMSLIINHCKHFPFSRVNLINYCWNLLLPNLENDLFNVCMQIASCAWQLKEYHYCFHKETTKLNAKHTTTLAIWAVMECRGTEVAMKNKFKNKLFPNTFGKRSGKNWWKGDIIC